MQPQRLTHLNRRLLPAVAFVLAALTALGCNPRINDGMVVGSTWDSRCPECYHSVLDNPVIRSTDRVGEIMGPNGDSSFESVFRTALGFTYQDFNLQLRANGDDRRGAVTTSSLVAEPLTPLDQEVHPGIEEGNFPWEVHGIELGYAETTAVGVHTNAWLGQKNVPLLPVKVQLAPGTMLVPIQQIRVVPAGQDAPFAWLKDISQRTYKKFWDDVTPFNTTRVSEPGKPVRRAIHAFATGEGKLKLTRPDLIWAQCRIQFRMIDCGSQLGCPDLVVDDPQNIAPRDCEAGGLLNFLHMRDNRGMALDLPGVKKDLPMVLTVGRVSGPCLNATPIDVADSGWTAIGLADQSEPLVVAHELGHVLGLDDDNSCSDRDRHLMCADTAWQSDHIRPDDCSMARGGAARYVQRQWDVQVER